MKPFEPLLMSGFERMFESLGDPNPRARTLETHLFDLQDRLREADRGGDLKLRADIGLQIARTLVELGRGAEAWAIGRQAFEVFITAEDYESAADVCEVLFRADQAGSPAALGQGIWLAVTYPVDPDLAQELLSHLVEEIPAGLEAAALAATTALFLIDLRALDPERGELLFFASQALSQVAQRDGVVSQEAFDRWLERLALRDPRSFLPRLRGLVESLVKGDWWFDRAALQGRLPVGTLALGDPE